MTRLDPARETARLRLRPFAGPDLDRCAELVADPSVNRYLYSQPRTADEARDLLEARLARDSDEPRMNVCVALRESDEMVGDFALWWDPTHRQGEMGGSLLPAHQGQGYATEVYGVLLGVAFDELGPHRLVGCRDARTEASIRSLERAGRRREAHFVEHEFVRGEWTSEVVLARRAEPGRAAR